MNINRLISFYVFLTILQNLEGKSSKPVTEASDEEVSDVGSCEAKLKLAKIELSKAKSTCKTKTKKLQAELKLLSTGTMVFFDANSKSYEAVMCEGKSLHIMCHEDKEIEIKYADYGRHDSTTCTSGIYNSNGNCTTFNKTMSVVGKECNKRHSCDLSATTQKLGNVQNCYVNKYLKVIYKCVQSDSSEH